VTRCKTPAAQTLTVSATSYCEGSGVTFALDDTERGATYTLYIGAESGSELTATLTGTGSPGTFTNPGGGNLIGAGTGVYSVQTLASQAFCAATVSNAVAVAERPLPVIVSFTANTATICETRSATLTAVAADTSRNLEYSITGSAWTPSTVKSYDSGSGDCVGATWETSATFAVTPTLTTTYPLYVRTAGGCSVTMAEPTVTLLPPPTIIMQPQSKIICPGTRAHLDVVVNAATSWQWYEGDQPVQESSGTTANYYITGVLTAPATYSVVVTNGDCPAVTSGKAAISMSTVTACCGGVFTNPDATLSFSAFSPCSATPVGTTWYLTDDRPAGGNNQTYKVQKMGDGKIWMVQDLRFGDCTERSWLVEGWNGAGGLLNVPTTLPTIYEGLVGHCRTASPRCVNAGYLYSWFAVMQHAEWDISSGTGPHGCQGTEICQGICPDGWHVPTGYPGQTESDFNKLRSYLTAPGATSNWWDGIACGGCTPSFVDGGAPFWWSAFVNNWQGGALFYNYNVLNSYGAHAGGHLRCVRN
jgi:uncharacterized protein (TIGR02145 family)